MAQQNFDFLTKLGVHIDPLAYRGEDGKSPYVDEEGYWWEFDDETRQYKNTGVRSDKAAAELALQAAQQAQTAKQGADDAAGRANAAASSAEQSTAEAGTATQVANNAAQAANDAAQTANTAASGAQEATEKASTAADRANEAADRAAQAASGAGLQKKVVDVLPSVEAMAEDVIYLVPSETPGGENNYDEYIKVNDKAEPFGPTVDAKPTEGSTNPVQSGGVYEATKWHSNPNMLDNWYFANPVNQKGQKEYKGNMFTIDRWGTYSADGNQTLTVEDGYIKFVADDFSSMNQTIEVYKQPHELTFTILKTDGTIDSVTLKAPETLACGFAWTIQLAFRSVESSNLIIATIVANYGSNEVVAAKLELGDKQTLARKEGDKWVLNDPQPNYSTELLKCQRYQYVPFRTDGDGAYIGPFFSDGNGNILGNISLPVTMRAKPAVIIDNSLLRMWNPGGSISTILSGVYWGMSNADLNVLFSLQDHIPEGPAGYIYVDTLHVSTKANEAIVIDANI